MSSISATDRSRQTEETRSSRDEYEGKEAELVKKQRKEIAKLNQAHEAEVDKLQKIYSAELDGLRNRNQALLSEKDLANQSKIEQVRSLYLDQMKKKSEDMTSRQQAAEQAFKSDLEKEREVHNLQTDRLEKAVEVASKSHEFDLSDFEKKAREEVAQSISDRTEKLNKKHTKEVEAITEDKDRVLTETQKTLSGVKLEGQRELELEKRAHENDKARLNSTFMTDFKNQDVKNTALVASRDERLTAEVKHNQDKYQRALEQKLSTLDKSREQLESQVDERLNTQVTKANSQVARIQNEKILESINQRRLSDLELGHVRQDYEDRFRVMQESGDQLREKVNENAHEKIVEATDANSRIMQDINRRNRMKENLATVQNHEDRAQLEANHAAEVDFLKGRTDKRVRRIITDTDKTLNQQAKFHEKSAEEMKNVYLDNLSNQRDQQTDEIKNIRMQMEGRLRESQNKASQKHEDLVENFQTKIEQLTEEKQKAIQRLEDEYQKKLVAQEKTHRTELETLSQKNEIQNVQSEEVHQKEMDRMEKRHQEQMAALTKQVAYYKRKA